MSGEGRSTLLRARRFSCLRRLGSIWTGGFVKAFLGALERISGTERALHGRAFWSVAQYPRSPCLLGLSSTQHEGARGIKEGRTKALDEPKTTCRASDGGGVGWGGDEMVTILCPELTDPPVREG